MQEISAHHRLHKEWQMPLSGVHFIMIEKLAHSGEGGGAHAHPPPPFTYKVVLYAPAERAGKTLFYPYMYSVVHTMAFRTCTVQLACTLSLNRHYALPENTWPPGFQPPNRTNKMYKLKSSTKGTFLHFPNQDLSYTAPRDLKYPIFSPRACTLYAQSIWH